MRIGVIGGGGWGTTLALVAATRGHDVGLWVYEPDLAARMAEARVNDVYLPGVGIPASIRVTPALEAAARGVELLLFVTPSHALRATATRLVAEAPEAVARAETVVVATKGLEAVTLERPSEILAETLPPRHRRRIVALVGPSHAEEVARGLPAAIVAASLEASCARRAQEALSCEWLRIYTNDDLLGVEIAVALKNVIAIAAGICDGLGFGDSTKAALLTRGLAEMTRLGVKLGARAETFAGLAGMGDLIATATSRHSRNRRLGEAVGKGARVEEALGASPMVVEGVRTADAAVALARRHEEELPITEQVRAILYEGKGAQEALRELFTRDLKSEVPSETRR